MNENQEKIAGLTMELDLRAREYKMLCDKLDKLKEENIDPNDERLIALKEMFITNSEEIREINDKLRKIKENIKIAEESEKKKYNSNDIFKNKVNEDTKIKEQKEKTPIVKQKESAFSKILNKIKSIFFKKENN